MVNNIPNNKHIVFINQASGYLMVDIVNVFADAGYSCELITGLLVERNHKLTKDVKIRNIIRYNHNTPLKRLFTWGWGTLQILFIILLKYRNAHLFILSNPPFAPLIPLLVKNQFSLLIFDVFPDAITELGFMSKRSLLIRLWENVNHKVFPWAENLFTITEGMKAELLKYSGGKDITVVPLWTDNEFLKPMSASENPFIQKNNLTGKFIVLYSGNISVSNNIDVLLEVAKLINNDKIVFVIIGGGARKEHLENRIKKDKISNCLLLPWQEVSQLPFTLSAASLAVVSLGEGASRLAIPSKLFSLMSVGAPILGITDQDSDLRKIIEKHQIGQCFAPGEINEIAKYILHLFNYPLHCKKLSDNALSASEYYTSKNALRFLDGQNITELTKTGILYHSLENV